MEIATRGGGGREPPRGGGGCRGGGGGGGYGGRTSRAPAASTSTRRRRLRRAARSRRGTPGRNWRLGASAVSAPSPRGGQGELPVYFKIDACRHVAAPAALLADDDRAHMSVAGSTTEEASRRGPEQTPHARASLAIDLGEWTSVLVVSSPWAIWSCPATRQSSGPQEGCRSWRARASMTSSPSSRPTAAVCENSSRPRRARLRRTVRRDGPGHRHAQGALRPLLRGPAARLRVLAQDGLPRSRRCASSGEARRRGGARRRARRRAAPQASARSATRRSGARRARSACGRSARACPSATTRRRARPRPRRRARQGRRRGPLALALARQGEAREVARSTRARADAEGVTR